MTPPYDPLAEWVYYPRWLPDERRDAFRRDCLQAFERFLLRRGRHALDDHLTRRRIIGGLAAAYRLGRIGNASWARSMAARRGGQAFVRRLSMAGVDRRAYFAELGRRGGLRSGMVRRQRAHDRWVATAHPRIRRLLEPHGKPSAGRSWLEF